VPGKISAPKLLLAASAVTLTALGGFLAVPSAKQIPSPATPAATRGTASSAASRTNDASRFFLLESGSRYVYGFRRGLTFQGDLGGATMPAVGFNGEFYVDVLRADARSFEAVVSERIAGAASPRSPLARIEVDARGDRLEFFRAEGLSEEDAQHVSIVKDLVALWLFPLRTDTVGDFEARFEALTAEPGFAREKKTKLAYRSHAPNTPSILSSEHYLLWDFALHLPKEIKGAETTRLGNGTSALVADSRYELRYRAREKAPIYGDTWLASLGAPDDLGLDTRKPASLAAHPDYQNLDWGKLLADLEGIDQLTGMKQLALFGDINKFLRLHPERAADLAARLLDANLLRAGAGSAEFKTLVGALATAGGAEAFAALRAALDSADLATDGKAMILASLTTTQAPIDAATRDYLARRMQVDSNPDLAQASGYALGSALQNAANDAQSAAAIAQIQNRYQASGTLSEQLALLDVMGNSGRSEFLPTLEGVLAGDAGSQLKAKATFALRFIPTAAAKTDLARNLSAPDAAVRDAAAGAIAISDWTESFRAPLESCASGETVSNIRASCRSTLGEHPQMAGSL